MSDLLRLLVLNAGLAGLGALVLAAAGLPRRRTFLPTLVGLAPATGLAVGGLCVTVGAMVGIDVRIPAATALALLVVGAVSLVSRRRGMPAHMTPVASGRAGRVVEALALTALAALSVTVLRLAAATGLDQWDGWAVWGAKAQALYVGGDVWSPVFTAPEYVVQHQEYPVLLPALEALSADALGRFDPVLIDVQAAAVVVAFGWAAWALLRLVIHPAVAAIVALALTGTAPLAVNAGGNYADSVVAAFTALGLTCLYLWLARDATAAGTVFLVLAGAFLAAASVTKNEGLLFTLIALAVVLVLAPGFGRRRATAGVLALLVLTVPGLWILVDRLNGRSPGIVDAGALLDPDYVAASAGRIPAAADALLDELVDGWLLAGLAVVVAVAAACVARMWLAGLFVTLWAGLSFGSLVLVYFASTTPIAWHLGTSADRVVYSIALGSAMIAPVLVMQAWESSAGRSSPGM